MLSTLKQNKNFRYSKRNYSQFYLQKVLMTSIPEDFSNAGFQILHSQSAAPSYDGTGRFIWSGRSSYRLAFEDLKQPEFYIAATKITNPKAPWNTFRLSSKKHVVIQINQDTFTLNLNSLSRRLHLPKESILEAVQAKSLRYLLSSDRLSTLPHLIKTYQNIISRYEVVNGQDLKHSDYPKLKLDKPLLMKVLKAALSRFSIAVENTTTCEQDFISIDNRKWLVIVNAGQIQLFDWTLHEISKSKWASVCKVWNVSHSCFKVLKKNNANYNTEQLGISKQEKTALTLEKHRGETKILREYAALTRLHRDKPILGIQLTPDIFLSEIFDNQSETKTNGFLGFCYPEDHLTLINRRVKPSLNILLQEFYQLMYGLKKMHELGMMHNDIKMENIFHYKNYVFISDFAGARILSKANGHSNFDKSIKLIDFSPSYISIQNYQELKKAEKAEDWETYAQIAFALDVFAIGLCCYLAIFNYYPYEHKAVDLDENGEIIECFPVPKTYEELQKNWRPEFLDTSNSWDSESLRLQGIPKPIITLLGLMLEPQWEKRISAAKAFKTLRTYMSKNHLGVLLEIDKLEKNLNNLKNT